MVVCISISISIRIIKSRRKRNSVIITEKKKRRARQIVEQQMKVSHKHYNRTERERTNTMKRAMFVRTCNK